ncbi:MAG TPA: type I phosphomannose isomerase catalytic subunit [Clostridiaceae bacterium]
MSKQIEYNIIKLNSERVWRTYLGGAILETWQGKRTPNDGAFPEEWVASTVKARNPGREALVNEGLSKISINGSPEVLLKDIIEADPVGYLGEQHYKKYGYNMSMLVKLIDSLNRLTIQVHPDKDFAKTVFSSDYGKTEAWYILGGRVIHGEDPYVLLGFKPGMTREKWKSLFDAQDIHGMFNSLHKIKVKQGDVYLIQGGVPHAIGSGCFLIETQEPTDYTIRVEKVTPEGMTLPDDLCHQGVGFEKMFDCFHYDSYSQDETLANWQIAPKLLFENNLAQEWALIDETSTKLFQIRKLIVNGTYKKETEGSYSILIAIKGKGYIEYNQSKMKINQGDMLFIPATIAYLSFESEESNDLEIILCLPPR